MEGKTKMFFCNCGRSRSSYDLPPDFSLFLSLSLDSTTIITRRVEGLRRHSGYFEWNRKRAADHQGSSSSREFLIGELVWIFPPRNRFTNFFFFSPSKTQQPTPFRNLTAAKSSVLPRWRRAKLRALRLPRLFLFLFVVFSFTSLSRWLVTPITIVRNRSGAKRYRSKSQMIAAGASKQTHDAAPRKGNKTRGKARATRREEKRVNRLVEPGPLRGRWRRRVGGIYNSIGQWRWRQTTRNGSHTSMHVLRCRLPSPRLPSGFFFPFGRKKERGTNTNHRHPLIIHCRQCRASGLGVRVCVRSCWLGCCA